MSNPWGPQSVQVTIPGTAAPWKFAAGANSAGGASTNVGYGVSKSDNTNNSGPAGNNAYAFGQTHGGDTAPITVPVLPGAVVRIGYNSGTVNDGAGGESALDPRGATSNTVGIGIGGAGADGGAGTADYTDGNGYVFPTCFMRVLPSATELVPQPGYPLTGRGGLVGCFTNASGVIIAGSFFDWVGYFGGSTANNGSAGLLGSTITVTAPAGAAFISLGINDSDLHDNTGSFVVTVAVSIYRGYGDADNAGAFGALYPPSDVEVAFAGTALVSQYNSGVNGVYPMQGGYQGLTWCKSVFAISFGYFDKSLSTPYSGQLFPTGASTTSSGQAWPTS